jgi:hypothetical protein
MKRRWRSLAGLVVAWAVLAAARPAAAQGLYRPATPTMSPWFNLYNKNTGPLDNYHQYVRPEFDLQSTLRQNDARLRFQGAGLQALGAEAAQGGQQGGVRPTGSASVFMSYSHYYPSGGQQSTLPGAKAGHRLPAAGQGAHSSRAYINQAMQGAR